MGTAKTFRMLSGVRPGRRALILGLVGAALFPALLLLSLVWSPPRFPSFEEVRAAHSRSDSVLLDRHGEILQEQRTDSSIRRLEWVPLEGVSPAFTAALLFAEDRRFYSHRGVDWTSLAGALAGFWGAGARGASTLSMQLAAQLDAQLRPLRQRRTIGQKWRQMRSACALETRWSKGQILEAYVNLVSFRGEIQGLSAAASGLFGKHALGLTSVESVILAALVRSPNASMDPVLQRACQLAGSMILGLDREEIAAGVSRALSHPYFIRPEAAYAPLVAQRLFREARIRDGKAPGRVVSTIDLGLQRFAAETLRQHILTVQSQNVSDGAVLVLDNTTGDVLAYVGNTGEQGGARFVDGVRALRQAGSTLKPFLYGAALERRLLTAVSLLDDSPLDVPVSGGIYRPANYDRMFRGPVTVRMALASSLNVPAVRALNLIGIDAAWKLLRAAGFDRLESADFYGPSLALGAADVSLWELVNAYRCLANAGTWSPARFTFESAAVPGRRVLRPGTAFIISDILSDRESRSQTFSLESPLSTRFWTAVKTGTSKDMRDNWCVGFSERYTAGVWAGNFSGEPMWNVSGITGAAPVWVEIMNRLHRNTPSNAPQPPPEVVARQEPGDNGRREWFLRGTERAILPGVASPEPRIVYPPEGMIVALDPDIPPGEQKVFFEAEPADGLLRWVLDGRVLGGAARLLLWSPVHGKHQLALIDASDRILDSVAFEVRGYQKQ